ncbi:hypothetical protein B879_03819 [Cecembia lonarensis LW9]|uniref:Uncharacterized protein n=1 Tax=Cecembia lonarensis (strain CCUG 58316 / KCTC 22772 / LW9) TaxID=1225176 RepID=K1L669_CECL9|nr:hypothetical protein B879_03819 [Cecembia lonarensis LW9]
MLKILSVYSECYTYQLEGLGKLGHRDLNKYGGEGRNAALPHFFPPPIFQT